MELTEEYGSERKSNGQFQAGNKVAANRGPNKVSTKVKESIVAFLEKNIDNIQESFDKLKDREKLQFISDILPYATPKLSSVQSEIDQRTEHSGGIEIKILK